MGQYYMGVPSPTTIITCLSVLLVLDFAVVVLRFYARKRTRQLFQADDWLTVPSLVFSVIMATNMLYGVSTKKLGYPINSLEDMTRGIPTRKHEYVTITIAPIALALVKLSCLFLYRRMFVVDKRNRCDSRNLFFAASISIMILWGSSISLSYLFICKTRWELLWGPPWDAAGKCLDYMKLGDMFIYSDFATDVLVLLIPIPFVWRLRLSLKKKAAVIGIFLLGILASVASLLRMLWMRWSREVGFDPNLDEALMTTFSLFWFSLEVQIGLLAACLPTLASLFRGIKLSKSVKTWWSSRSGSRSDNSPFPKVANSQILGSGQSLVLITEHPSTGK